ncbi:HN1_G0037190.mRNA.1.CDS.1 [Saccharomyces cerevisiae]|nr:HN1_G0037190.mRNA.1.CDS.1 [Saccharomyces cerevisiae]CAI4737512.1 BAL_1a_G0048100.mRNA.1.CDS.1 [Saccharomyces cerevisiae]CAI7327653.1 BAL_1a_G0048100.mRNA.1.CDS.1 [Saccharomyces cerevisiae]
MKVSQVFISAISAFGLATSVNAQNASNTTSNAAPALHAQNGQLLNAGVVGAAVGGALAFLI